MAKINFGTIKTLISGNQVIKYLTVTIAVAAVMSSFIWMYYEIAPSNIAGEWVFSGVLNTNIEEEDPMKYDGWIVQVSQNGDAFEGFDGNGNRVVYGMVGGKDINFVIEIDDDPDECGDFSELNGSLTKTWALAPYNAISGNMEGHDCANFSQWTGYFEISINP